MITIVKYKSTKRLKCTLFGLQVDTVIKRFGFQATFAYILGRLC